MVYRTDAENADAADWTLVGSDDRPAPGSLAFGVGSIAAIAMLIGLLTHGLSALSALPLIGFAFIGGALLERQAVHAIWMDGRERLFLQTRFDRRRGRRASKRLLKEDIQIHDASIRFEYANQIVSIPLSLAGKKKLGSSSVFAAELRS